jgi:hypothetical protein
VDHSLEKCKLFASIFKFDVVRSPIRTIPYFDLLSSDLRLIFHYVNNMSNQVKAKNRDEFTDIAQMQRRRLERVIDPIKYMLTVESTDFHDRMRTDFHAFERKQTVKILLSNQQTSLVLSALPLAYLTKSLLFPLGFVIFGTVYRIVESSD